MEKMYSSSEAAEVLGVSRVTVFNRIKIGKLVAQKIGRNYVIRHGDLMEALGQTLSAKDRAAAEKAVRKAVQDFGETFRKLARE